MKLTVNQEGVALAKQLIKEGKVDKTTRWSEGKPSREQGNEFIESHSMKDYGKWFLAVNSDQSSGDKSHYEFPFGDFKKIFRDGVIAAEVRAGQYHHPEIEAAAKQLLQLIDQGKK